MSTYEIVTLWANVASALVATFAAYLTWREQQRKRAQEPEAVRVTVPAIPHEASAQQLGQLIVDTVQGQRRQFFWSHILFSALLLLATAGVVLPLLYWRFPIADKEAMKNIPIFDFLFTFFAPLVAFSLVGVFFTERAGRKRAEKNVLELRPLLMDSRFTPTLAAEIAGSFAERPADASDGLRISILMFYALAARNRDTQKS